MVDTEQEVALTKQEKAAFVHPKSTSSCLPTYRAVPLFCSSAETAPHKHSLPSSFAAAWPRFSLALAPFLTEPETHGHLGPIRSKSCWQVRVKAADTFFTLPHYFLFGGLEGFF